MFAWSATLEESYGYALADNTLTHVLLEAVAPMFESPVTQHWLALEGASALAKVDEAINATYAHSSSDGGDDYADDDDGTKLVAAVLTDLLSRTRTRVAVLPLAWQRRAYLMHVHTPALRRLVEHVTRLVDSDLLICVESNRFEWLSALGQLHYVGTVRFSYSRVFWRALTRKLLFAGAGGVVRAARVRSGRRGACHPLRAMPAAMHARVRTRGALRQRCVCVESGPLARAQLAVRHRSKHCRGGLSCLRAHTHHRASLKRSC